MDIKEIFEIEPALEGVVCAARDTENAYAAYSDAKSAADNLIGHGARNIALRNAEAYETFTRHLVEAIGL